MTVTVEGNEIIVPAPAIPSNLMVEKIDPAKVTWSTGDEQLATVTANGVVTLTGASGQSVTISVSITTDQGNTYKCDIPVTIA